MAGCTPPGWELWQFSMPQQAASKLPRSPVLAASFSSPASHCHLQLPQFQGKIHRGPLTSLGRVGKCFVTDPTGCQAAARSSLWTLFRKTWCQSDSATWVLSPLGRLGFPGHFSNTFSGTLFPHFAFLYLKAEGMGETWK